MGRNIALPCDVGDTLYIVTEYRGIIQTKVRTFWIGKISQVEDLAKHKVLMIRTEAFDMPADEFGKKAFLTREEADAAANANK